MPYLVITFPQHTKYRGNLHLEYSVSIHILSNSCTLNDMKNNFQEICYLGSILSYGLLSRSLWKFRTRSNPLLWSRAITRVNWEQRTCPLDHWNQTAMHVRDNIYRIFFMPCAYKPYYVKDMTIFVGAALAKVSFIVIGRYDTSKHGDCLKRRRITAFLPSCIDYVGCKTHIRQENWVVRVHWSERDSGEKYKTSD